MARLSVTVYCVCHNERILLPLFVEQYAWAQKIVVYDDNSTDGCIALVESTTNVDVRRFSSGGVFSCDHLLQIKNEAWKECRKTETDYVVIVDCDEFLEGESIPTFLAMCKRRNVSIIWPNGYEKVEGSGGFFSHWHCKPCVFSPNHIASINYNHACNDCSPVGEVRILRTDEIRLQHQRYWSRDLFLERSRQNRERQLPSDVDRGLCVHHAKSDAQLLVEYRDAAERSSELPAVRTGSLDREYVIARFSESVAWTRSLSGIVTIYNKGSDPVLGAPFIRNVGRESGTYLLHIVSHYRALAEVTIFCQGRVEDHPMLDGALYGPFSKDFDYLTETISCDWDGGPNHPGLPLVQTWRAFLPDISPPDRLEFGPGALFYASRRAILRHPLEFYQSILRLHDSQPSLPWVMERFWKYIFDCF